MTRLEDLTPNAAIRGIIPDQTVTVVNTQWFGSEALELTYKDSSGRVANELLYRYDEPRIELVEFGRPWSFDGDGALFRLVSEANRIRLAHLFDHKSFQGVSAFDDGTGTVQLPVQNSLFTSAALTDDSLQSLNQRKMDADRDRAARERTP